MYHIKHNNYTIHPFKPTERPPVRKIEEELEIASRTPTWTNLAYQNITENDKQVKSSHLSMDVYFETIIACVI